MYETCPFSREEFLISSDLEKQAVKERERGYSTNRTVLSAFVVAAKHLKFLSKFPFVVCFYSPETRRKLALKSLWRFLPFYTPSAVKDNRAISSIKACLSFVQCSSLWGEEWEGPLWYFVVAIKLSLIAADTVSINWNLPWLGRNTHTHTCSLTQSMRFESTIRHWHAIFRHSRKHVMPPWIQINVWLHLLKLSIYSNVYIQINMNMFPHFKIHLNINRWGLSSVCSVALCCVQLSQITRGTEGITLAGKFDLINAGMARKNPVCIKCIFQEKLFG